MFRILNQRLNMTAAQVAAPASIPPLDPPLGAPSKADAAPPLPGSLHYGGSLNPKTGTLGPKPAAKRLFKAQKRLEMMVRMENAGIPEHAAAAMLTISVPRYRLIKKSADYLKARMRITHGLVIDHDASLSEIKEQRKEMLTAMLPDALQVIANAVRATPTSLAQQKLQVTVAQDLLDREGTFAKVSRSEIKTSPNFDWSAASKSSHSLVDIIRAASQQGAVDQNNVQTVIELSEKFSRSHTLSAVDQQQALIELEASVLDMTPASPEIQ